jgi:NitT/TauT family transport system substrate-binding protein
MMKRSKQVATSVTKRFGLKLAAAALMLGAALPGQAQQREKVVLMLNWYLYAEHAPFFLGRERGFFEAEGIDLEIQEGRGSGPTVQAVATRTVNFGYADVATMIRVASKGAPVRAVGVALQTSPMSVIGLSEKNISKPADIKGKTIAMTPGDAMSQVWPLFLKKTGLVESDYKVVSGDAQTKLNAVINGQADVLLGYVMDQTMRITDATKKPTNAIRFADYGVNLVNSGVIAHADTIRSNPELVRRFMRASTRAFEESVKAPEAAVDAMLKANNKAGQRDTLIAGLKMTLPLYNSEETKGQRPFRVSAKNMAESFGMLQEFGGVDKSAGKAEDYYTNDFLPR